MKENTGFKPAIPRLKFKRGEDVGLIYDPKSLFSFFIKVFFFL